MQQNILPPYDLKNILFFMERSRNDCRYRLILERRPIKSVELHQVGNIDKAVDPFDLLVGQAGTGCEQFHHLFRHRR